MFRLKSGARAIVACTGITLLCVAACGSARDTPFYGVPLPPEGSASSGALTNSGGDANPGTGGTPIDVAGTSSGSVGGTSAGNSGTSASTGGTAASAGAGGSGAVAGTGAGGEATGTGGSGDTTPPQGGEAGVSDGSGGTSATSHEAGAGGEGPAPVVDCSPHGALAEPFDGHCYELSDGIKTFDDARSDCVSLGAHLVTISSAGRTVAQFLAENSFVWQLTSATESWIGATDGKGPHQPGDGTYSTWITGEPMTFDNWSSGEPNNARSSCQTGIPCSCDQGACYEHCGFLWDTPGTQMNAIPGWNDRVCDHQLPYVCEWDE